MTGMSRQSAEQMLVNKRFSSLMHVFFFPLSHSLSEAFSPKSDSELVVRPSESLLRAESHIQWTWGEFPETARASSRLR